MLPEERARIKIDNQLVNAGWDVVSRHEYIPNSASAVKEALMQGNTESFLRRMHFGQFFIFAVRYKHIFKINLISICHIYKRN